MNETDTVERELNEMLEGTEYRVLVYEVNSTPTFTVLYQEQRIGAKFVRARRRPFVKGARWARELIKDHRQAIEILGSLKRP